MIELTDGGPRTKIQPMGFTDGPGARNYRFVFVSKNSGLNMPLNERVQGPKDKGIPDDEIADMIIEGKNKEVKRQRKKN